MLTEEQRATSAGRLTGVLITIISAELAWVEEDDFADIAVAACVGVSVALAAGKCVDAPAAVALIHSIAESAAEDIYGTLTTGEGGG